METDEIVTNAPGETEEIGERIAHSLEPGDAVVLHGGLAAGKTTLVRGLARGLGADPGEVDSPTFVIVQSYPCVSGGAIRRLHHVDLYRLHHATELDEIGLEELLSEPDAVTAVEWPRDLLHRRLPPAVPVWTVRLEMAGEGRRRIAVHPPAGRRLT